MADVFRLSGAACTSPEGRAALGRLGERLFGPGRGGGPGSGAGSGDLIVLAEGLADTRHLPGGIILIGRPLVESSGSPEALAGFVLAEAARADSADPLADLLNWAGVRASLGLLASGSLRPERILGYAERLLTLPPTAPEDRFLAERMARAGVAPAAYATAAGLSPAAAEKLAAAVEARTALPASGASAADAGTATAAAPGGQGTTEPTDRPAAATSAAILSDADWVALQAICEG
jgi:hypothetical protein